VFLTKLEPAMAEWARTMAPFKGAKLVVDHSQWAYFFARYGLVLAGTVGGNDVCGSTPVEYGSDGRITSADIEVVQAIFRGPQCQRTVVHETGHAIGFLAHTADGGLMDPDGGSGEITSEDVTFIQSLYALAPGTFVGRGERTRVALARSGGRRSVMIVDPVRR
jgi:hypothetical protein